MELDWLLFVILPVLGHVLYGLPPDPADAEDSGVKLHNGDSFTARDEPPNPDRLLAVRAVSRDGATALTAEGGPETGVTIDVAGVRTRPCWVVVETPRTFIEIEGKKFHGYLGHEGLDDVIGRRTSAGQANEPGREIYSKYVKVALNDDNGALRLRTEPVGLPVEIVPLLDGNVVIGAPLSVKVLVDDLPGADLQLRVSHRAFDGEPSEDVLHRTDENGMASVLIDRAGIWRLHTISMAPLADGREADWESRWASVTFRV